MKILYSHSLLFFTVLFFLNFAIGTQQSFAKDVPKREILPLSNPKPIKALPFKPLPFKTFLPNVELYEFNPKAFAFDKIVGIMPVLNGKELKAISNDPIKFTLTPNKTSAQLGEEIELTLTAELMDVSHQLLFTFDELRDYTMKVVLPKDFILTGGTYYDFVSGTLDPANHKKQYTLKGKFLDKPAVDDCFKVLRKLNNEVFILKNTTCIDVKDIDVVRAVSAETLNSARETLTDAIDITKVKVISYIDKEGSIFKDFGENGGTFDINCNGSYLFLITFFISDGANEVIDKGGSFVCKAYKNDQFFYNRNMELLYESLSLQHGVTKYTLSIEIYSSSNGGGTLLGTKTTNVFINQGPCPTSTSLKITASETTVCPGNSSTLTATGDCPATNISWKRNGTSYGTAGSNSFSTIESGTYTATCSNPVLTSNSISIVSTTNPSVPQLSTNKHAITPGEFATLSATNCQGTVIWHGPNNFEDTGDQMSTNKPGTYYAICMAKCSTNTYYSDQSGNINIALLPLRL